MAKIVIELHLLYFCVYAFNFLTNSFNCIIIAHGGYLMNKLLNCNYFVFFKNLILKIRLKKFEVTMATVLYNVKVKNWE